jgi:hypothetical protein
MSSIRVRRIHAAENPKVIIETAEALTRRWTGRAASLSPDAGSHAATIVGMFAAMATEAEVAEYLRTVEQVVDPAAPADVAFASDLLRIVLRLDEVAGRSPRTLRV